jgi:diadenosine tetraphosphatase ApaH/serine/threonine PP2A family protein phosphatase
MSTEAPRRFAIFSDIHGNNHALNAVLDHIDELRIRTLVCLGDVVGYGAFPNECCETLRFRRIPTIAGNHDHAALERTDIKFFNDIAKAAVQWTRERLSPENIRWLSGLPYTHVEGDCLFVHATPHNPERWGYVMTFGDARQCFSEFTQRFCFVGHSHQPAIVEQLGDELTCHEGTQVSLADGRRYLINVGSVGQPRDHNPDACLVTLDLDRNLIEFHRIAYDVEAAQEAIRANNLPVELAERLAFGW